MHMDMGLGIFRYAASLPAQTAERMSRRLAHNSASKRRRVWLRSLLAAAVAVAFASTALAEKRVALLVANGSYKGAPLENPTVDADLVAASLTNIGFVVKVMKNVDLDEFDRGVTEFAREANGADVALFYFAGHGFAVTDGLKPVSVLMSTSVDVAAGSERVLRAGGIPLDDIVGSLAGEAKATLIFVDACRNDPRISRAMGAKGRGFRPLDSVRGGRLFIGLSTRLGDTADDGVAGKGSPFARAFSANIQTLGIRIDDAFRRLRDAVGSETGDKQLPDIVQDDLPDGAVTLVGAQREPAAPVAHDDVAPRPPASGDEKKTDAQLREAARVWATLQGSDDPDALALFKSKYAGTFYADLADRRLQKIPPKTQPSSPLASVEPDLQGNAAAGRGWLGVRIQPVDDRIAESLQLGAARGALVAAIDENGPVKAAGVVAGDVIIKFDGKEINESRDLPRFAASMPVGKQVEVVIMRKGQELTKTVTLGRLEDGEKQTAKAEGATIPPESESTFASVEPDSRANAAAGRGWLGVRLQPVNDAGARFLGLGTARGALVAGVAENGAAKAAGLMLGDVIVKFDGKEIRLPRDLARLSSSMPVGRQVEVVIVRRRQELTKTVTLGRLADDEK